MSWTPRIAVENGVAAFERRNKRAEEGKDRQIAALEQLRHADRLKTVGRLAAGWPSARHAAERRLREGRPDRFRQALCRRHRSEHGRHHGRNRSHDHDRAAVARFCHQAHRNGAAGRDLAAGRGAPATATANPLVARDPGPHGTLRGPAGEEPRHATGLRPTGADRRFRRLGVDYRGARLHRCPRAIAR